MKNRLYKKMLKSAFKPNGLKTEYDWRNYDLMKGKLWNKQFCSFLHKKNNYKICVEIG